MSKLIVVSNRLPIILAESNGSFSAEASVGGLAQGLNAFLQENDMDYLWIGWPGVNISQPKQRAARNYLLSNFQVDPIFITSTEKDDFYEGFCNEILWPLFHYFPSKCRFADEYWQAYQKINERFAEKIIGSYRNGDIVFIQDYHLMLVPQLVRNKIPGAEIAFFLHIPFPSFEIFRILPSAWRLKILEGILGADLIGMHTDDYVHYFLDSVLRITGFTHQFGTVLYNDRLVKTKAIPLGIQFGNFFSKPEGEVESMLAELQQIFAGKKVILSVDRLDYSKGIYKRLEAFSYFLDHYPEFHQKVSMVVIAVPSRTNIHEYQKMRDEISLLISEINGRYGTIGWLPITYQLRSFDHTELSALYKMADICLVTPLRDGMNLIAKEYIASLNEGKGVLILSELTGAAKELQQALLVNPNSSSEIGRTIAAALAMPDSEQVFRNREMQNYLREHGSNWWYQTIFTNLKGSMKQFAEKKNPLSDQNGDFSARIRSSNRRLLLLDYDGTLTEYASRPELAKPSNKIIKLLNELSSNKKNTVVIVSGRDKKTMDAWFGKLGITLVAEHGAMINKGKRWKNAAGLSSSWKPFIEPVLKKYADKIDDSFIEEKDFALAWHYRNAEPEISSAAAKDLMHELFHLIANMDIQVLEGSKVLEVKNAGVNKGSAALEIAEGDDYDLIFAAGDDVTDEEMFGALKNHEHALTIKIGSGPSKAKYRLNNPAKLHLVLKQLVSS